MKPSRMLIGSAILLLLIIIGSATQTSILWGVNSLGYLPPLYTLITIIGSVLIFMALVGLAQNSYDNPGKQPVYPSYIRIIGFVLLFVIAIGAMYILKSETQLWGDGYLRANETNNEMLFHFSEPLDKFSQYLFFTTAGDSFHLSSFQTYQIVSIIGGIMFLGLALWFISHFGRGRIDRLIMGALIFSSAIIQLFFGYVESYSISTPLFLFSIGLIYYELTNQRPLVWGLIVYFIACAFHMSLMAYLPAYIWLAVHAYKARKTPIISPLIAIAVPIVLLFTVYLLHSYQFENEFDKNLFSYLVIPLLPNESGYWLLSPYHLLEMINQLLLVAPAGLIIFATFNPLKLKQYSRNDFYKFTIALSICGLLFLLLFNTSFGIGRDWDLFSSLAIPLNILAAMVLVGKLMYKKINPVYLFAPLLPALIITISFVFSNSLEKPSVERYKDTVSLHKYGRHLNLENLATYYHFEEDTAAYYETLLNAAKIYRHPRYFQKIGTSYLQHGRTEEAVQMFYKALEIDQHHVPSLNYLGLTYSELGAKDPKAYSLGEQFLQKVIELEPDFEKAHYNLGRLYLNTGMYLAARQNFLTAIELDDDYLAAYANLALTFVHTDQIDSADYYYRRILEMEPDRPKTYLDLAQVHIQAGNREDALAVLEKAERRFDDPQVRLEIARAMGVAGSLDDAVAILQNLLEKEDYPLEVAVTLANIYNMRNDHKHALQTISSAAEDHQKPSDQVQIAETFLQLNAPDSAEVYLLNVVARAKTYPQGYLKLATHYLLQGKNDRAAEILEMGLGYIQNPEDRARLQSMLDKLQSE